MSFSPKASYKTITVESTDNIQLEVLFSIGRNKVCKPSRIFYKTYLKKKLLLII